MCMNGCWFGCRLEPSTNPPNRSLTLHAGTLPRGGRVAAEADAGLLNPSQNSVVTGFSTSPHAACIVSRSEPRWCTTQLGARAPLKTACKKLFSVRRRCGKTSAQGGVWAHDDGAEWKTRWTDGACRRNTHRCSLSCCSTLPLLHPLRPPSPKIRRAEIQTLIQSRRGAALSRR